MVSETKTVEHDGILSMHPVLCLWENDRVPALDNTICDLHSPFSRQTVHEICLRACSFHQSLIHLHSKVFKGHMEGLQKQDRIVHAGRSKIL
jgi:hypothetical protein